MALRDSPGRKDLEALLVIRVPMAQRALSAIPALSVHKGLPALRDPPAQPVRPALPAREDHLALPKGLRQSSPSLPPSI